MIGDLNLAVYKKTVDNIIAYKIECTYSCLRLYDRQIMIFLLNLYLILVL